MSAFLHLRDPDNPENANAGNGGDLVKHTALLTMTQHLVRQPRWRDALRIRECHAGRGVYLVGDGDPRRASMKTLLESALLLGEAQRAALTRVGAFETEGAYAGSSLLLDEAAPHAALHEAYEWDPKTRAILRGVARATGRSTWSIVGGDEQRVDGESLIARRVGQWDDRDLVVLDPFGLWRHAKHAFRRARYRRLIERWAGMRSRPNLFVFFTWGQDARGEARDLAHDCALFRRVWGPVDSMHPAPYGPAVVDGYRSLRALAAPLLRLRWNWDLRCVVWLAVSEAQLEPLRRALELELDALFGSLAPSDAWAELSMVYGPR